MATWRRFVRELTESYERRLVTLGRFKDDIRLIVQHPNSSVTGLVYQVESEEPFDEIRLGLEGSGDPSHKSTHLIRGNRQVSCVLYVWSKKTSASPTNLEPMMIQLFKTFWKSPLRANPSGLISIKDFEEAKICAQNTLDVMTEAGEASSILICDLDNFKLVNRVSYHEGDRVIQEFASLLEKVGRDVAILLNCGGDEFVVFYPGGSHEEALLLAYAIKQEVSRHDFGLKDISIDVSSGIATTDSPDMPGNFSDLLNESENALQKEVKEKTPGLARFASRKAPEGSSGQNREALKLASCITKSNLLSVPAYSNVWLSALSMFVSGRIGRSGFSPELVQRSADDFLGWAGLYYDSRLSKASVAPEGIRDPEPSVSLFDIAMAVGHSVLGSLLRDPSSGVVASGERELHIRFSKKRKRVALVFGEDMSIWSSPGVSDLAESFNLGHVWRRGEDKDVTSESLQRAVLIKIGHEELGLPESLFAETIVVDDRPTRGGGLPDFWEATIARLVARLSRNPNISLALVIGSAAYGARTIERLQSVGTWDADFIHRKTGMPVPHIQACSERLQGNVRMVKTADEVVTVLASLLQGPHEPLPVSDSSVIGQRPRTLVRRLEMDVQALTTEDGCRVSTIREAFPTVLEIARNATGEATIYDQAGRELFELVDFKVHLSDPLRERVPDFYTEEEDSLRRYFEMQFLSDKGLFGSVFAKTRQLKPVIEHVVESITRSPKPFATRRSILVVPHQPKRGQELTPLGLVSVRCIPRISLDKITLNYSYTWRTVEALVGFPYSIYGSVCYSEFLAQEICSKLSDDLRARVKMGFVSYVAHSLHIFRDDYGQNIAKRIVDEASK